MVKIGCSTDRYINFFRTHQFVFSHTAPLWRYCGHNRQLCRDQDFLSDFCSLFPFQAKTKYLMHTKT